MPETWMNRSMAPSRASRATRAAAVTWTEWNVCWPPWGGYGSGRSGGRPTVEDSLSLNLPRFFMMGWLKPGAWTSGTLRWTIVGIGKETASIGFEARLGEEEGHVRLHWTSANRWSGEKRQCENRIELTTRAQPLGGRR